MSGRLHLLAGLGAVLVLGGLGHFFGITRLYITEGVPDANRVLLDVWIGEAQIMAGALYLAAFRAARAGGRWRALAVFGALTVMAWTVPVLPVLFSRAPVQFRVVPIVYLAVSVWVLAFGRQGPSRSR